MLLTDDCDLHSHSWSDMRDLAVILARCKLDKPVDLESLPDANASDIASKLEYGVGQLELLQLWVHDDISVETIDLYRIVYAFDN